jgi:hypothetical protein
LCERERAAKCSNWQAILQQMETLWKSNTVLFPLGKLSFFFFNKLSRYSNINFLSVTFVLYFFFKNTSTLLLVTHTLQCTIQYVPVFLKLNDTEHILYLLYGANKSHNFVVSGWMTKKNSLKNSLYHSSQQHEHFRRI